MCSHEFDRFCRQSEGFCQQKKGFAWWSIKPFAQNREEKPQGEKDARTRSKRTRGAEKGVQAARYSPDSSEEDTPSPGWTLEESISRKAGLEVTRTLMRTSRPSLWSR